MSNEAKERRGEETRGEGRKEKEQEERRGEDWDPEKRMRARLT